jgi:hypothetical protein
MISKSLVALSVLVLVPLAASAQSADDQTPQSQGPMRIERVHSGLLAAPDYKVTDVDHTTSQLLGGYAGWITDDTFFIGGGGYWLVNGSPNHEMAYGGVILQWLARTNRTIGYGVKGLIGGGEAELSTTVSQLVRVPAFGGFRFDPRIDQRVNQVITTQVRTHEGFFIAEPQADLFVRVTNSMRVTVGAGYRLIGADHGASDRLRGAVGTIGFQIGGGS